MLAQISVQGNWNRQQQQASCLYWDAELDQQGYLNSWQMMIDPRWAIVITLIIFLLSRSRWIVSGWRTLMLIGVWQKGVNVFVCTYRLQLPHKCIHNALHNWKKSYLVHCLERISPQLTCQPHESPHQHCNTATDGMKMTTYSTQYIQYTQ